MTLLQVNRLTKRFRGLMALDDVSFSVDAGEIVGLIGPNGAGKTTCFNVISGFLRPTYGRLLFRDNDITGMPPHQVARLGLVRTFQQSAAFMDLTVYENIRTACFIDTSPTVLGAIFGTARHRRNEQASDAATRRIIDIAGLDSYADERASSLSFGYLRRLGIAIALAARPKCLMLDEPAAGLNLTETRELLELIRKTREADVTIVIVEHDMKLIMALCDRLIVLDHGTKLTEGDPASVRNNPDVIRSYLGTQRRARGQSNAAH